MAAAFELYENSVRCVSCGFEAENESTHLKHVKKHVYDFNFKIKCVLCPRFFTRMDSYYRHRKVCNSKISVNTISEKKVSVSERFWKCTSLFCDEKIPISGTESKDFEKVTKHLRKHALKKDRVICPIAICGIPYTKTLQSSNLNSI